MGKAVVLYFFRILIAIDQLGNTIFLGGEPDHTISGRVGHRAFMTKRWYWLYLEAVIDFIFFWQPNHCYRSIEWDEVKKDKRYPF
jgi:hypothetical protein|tara:strand:- start:274 stop:528 length:255 start_codon:yes stop_codon:yes gene_type:complete